MVLLGAAREILGSGTLFNNAAQLLGSWAHFIEITLIDDYKGFLLIILPPGGFLVMGFILAMKRLLDRKMAEREQKATEASAELQPESS